MTSEALNELLQQMLAAHGVETIAQDGWLLSTTAFPALRGTWHPKENHGRLDIEIALGNGRTIYECFAGIGEDQEGCRDALDNLSRGSFHVLLAALWGHVEKDQVEIETWQVGRTTWNAYVGNFVRRAFGGKDVPVPDNAFQVIEEAAKREALTPGLHWIRTFFANTGSGDTTIEALLDNETWDAGIAAYKALPWPKEDNYYSVRNFLILRVPGADPSESLWLRALKWVARVK